MKTKLLTILAAGCLLALSACGDDSSESLADKCKDNNGVTEGCIVGTWTLKALYNKSNNVATTDYSAAPATLIIKGDGTYTYTTTSAPSSEMASTGCGGATAYGKWDIEGDTIKFHMPNGTDCFLGGSANPNVDEFTMNMNKVLFQAGDNTDPLIMNDIVEIFDRVGE